MVTSVSILLGFPLLQGFFTLFSVTLLFLRLFLWNVPFPQGNERLDLEPYMSTIAHKK